MKSIISFPQTLVIFILLISVNFASAQKNTTKAELIDTKNLAALLKLDDSLLYDSENAVSETKVSTKAIRNFKSAFKNVGNEKWYVISNGFLAQFNGDNIKNAVVYNKKGKWQFTICYYNEKQLPTEVRALVKTAYYDYSIHRVEEIHVDEKIIYLIHLENEKTWKKARVCDGEIQLIEDFNKQ